MHIIRMTYVESLVICLCLLVAPGIRAQTFPQARQKHIVGIGAAYQPGPGTRLLGAYEYRGFDAGIISAAFGWSERLFGSVGSSLFIPFTESIRVRSEAGINFFTEYEPDRLLDGSITDERRTGMLVQFELSYLLPGDNHLLTSQVQGRYTVVTLHPEGKDRFSDRLITLDLVAHYVRGGPPGSVVQSTTLVPRLRAGFEPSGKLDYISFGATGGARRLLMYGLEVVIDGRAEIVTSGTPSYERVSFGGIPGVRGFRRDDATGLSLWILQNELWIPIPGMDPGSEGIGGIIGRFFRLASFFDIGGVYRTLDTESGIRTGFGAGLRVLFGPAVIRADWARGFGVAATGHGKGRLYLSLGASMPM